MISLAEKIMERVSAHGRGKWVCTPKDFLDLGSREAVDQALSRLVKAEQLRRVGHGLYDLPRMSAVEADGAGRSRCRHRCNREAGWPADHARWPGGREPLGSDARGPGQGHLPDGRPLQDTQDRRADGPVPACAAERHAVGGKTLGPGCAGVAVAWPGCCCRQASRSDAEAPTPRRGENRPV